MTAEELFQRITLARTPTIATEDALTVAKLHDVVIEYVNALDQRLRWSHWSHGFAIIRLEKAERALRVVSGVQP